MADSPMDGSDRIYVVDADERLHPLVRSTYASEDLLQTLLERYPDLLAGDEMRGEVPRRWVLVSRETGVPGEAGGANRWSLDHLFLDQDGIPTLVEVKRSTDTRIRREVVGQMLDYAANAVVYWPVERLVAEFEATCDALGDDPAERIAALTGDANGWETYWQRVKTNLQAGRVRMVFLADEIPTELRRIVEFLNGQMDPAEVLAVEVRQYVGESGLRTLVPRVVGQTAQSEQKKAGVAHEKGRQWDEASFLATLEEGHGAEVRGVAEALLRWAEARGLRLWWGYGRIHGSFFPMLDLAGDQHGTFAAWNTSGTIEVRVKPMRAPFDTEERKRELLGRLKAIPGVLASVDSVATRPGFKMRLLADPAALRAFTDAFDWMLDEIRTHRVSQ